MAVGVIIIIILIIRLSETINRYQRVSINNHFSDLLPVVSGVPQGNILGPLLFLAGLHQ